MDHKGNLAKVCRTCGIRFRLKKGNPKPVTAFREVILYLFNGSDVTQDEEDIHPPFVCDKCRCVLRNAQATMKTGKAPITMLGDRLPDFQPHLEDNCFICNYKPTGRPVKKNPRSLKGSSPADIATLQTPGMSREDAPLQTSSTSQEHTALQTPASASQEDAPLQTPDHKQKLARMCRICGIPNKPKKHRNPAPVCTFRETIAYLYDGYDVQHDTEHIHPPSVCWKCQCALKRVQEKISKGEAPNTLLPSKLADFVPHGDSCNICTFKKAGRPVKKHPGLRVKSKVSIEDVPSTSEPYPDTPEPSTWQSSVPEQTTSDSSVPKPCTSQSSLPEPYTSQSSVPEPSTSQSSVPEQTMPDSSVPAPSTLQSSVPEQTTLQSTADVATLQSPASTSQEDAPLQTPGTTYREEAPLDLSLLGTNKMVSDHKIKLLGVCRVCGLRFKCKKGRNPKPAHAFREPISYLYEGFDVGCDKEDIHPSHVCDKCRNALWKVQTAITEGKAPKTMLPGKLPDFSPHTEDNCSICNYKETGRPVKKNIGSKGRVQEVTPFTAILPASHEDVSESFGPQQNMPEFFVPEPATFKFSVPEPYTSESSVPEPYTLKSSVPEPCTSQFSVPEPSTFQSSVPEPSTSQSSVPEPSTSQSSVPEPSTSQSSVPEPFTLSWCVMPNGGLYRLYRYGYTSQSSVPEPSTSKSFVPEPSTSQSSVPEPSTSQSSVPEPSTSKSSVPEPSISKSSVPELSTSQSSGSLPQSFVPEPSTSQSSVTERSTSQSYVPEPFTSQSSVPEPSTSQSPIPAPSTSQSSVPAPSTSQSSVPEPSSSQPSVPEPSTSQSSVPGFSTSQSSVPEPSSSQPSVPESSSSQPSVPESSTAQSYVPGPSTLQSSVPESSTSQSSVPEPSSSQPSVPEPSSSQPSVPGSSTSQSSVPEPSSSQPSVPESSSSQPSVPESSTAQSYVPEPSSSQPSVPGSSTSQSSVPEPSSSQPSVPASSTSKSSVPEPSTSQSYVPESSVREPSTSQSSVPEQSTTKPFLPGPHTCVLKSEEIVAEAGRHGFILAGTKKTGTLVLVKFRNINEEHMSVSMTVDVEADRTWQLHVQNKSLSPSSPQLSEANLPAVLSKSTCKDFFWYLSYCFICIGNIGYDSLLDARREGIETVTLSKLDGTVAAREEVGTFKEGRTTYTRTIRHTDCHVLLPPTRRSARCECCVKYASSLRSALAKSKVKSDPNISASSTVPHKYLSKEQLIAKLAEAQRERNDLRVQADTLKRRYCEAFSTEGFTLNGSQHNHPQIVENTPLQG
ncbi:uncharacterized protein [Branchiostoma lanceolatum]|uniref:uncharacterized protein n=1 Tax=Branchiostoma lanceolatum TaxID=7740 RepID=UPI0034543F39